MATKYINDYGYVLTDTVYCGGEVMGNCEVYKGGYKKDIEYCYEVFNKLMEI